MSFLKLVQCFAFSNAYKLFLGTPREGDGETDVKSSASRHHTYGQKNSCAKHKYKKCPTHFYTTSSLGYKNKRRRRLRKNTCFPHISQNIYFFHQTFYFPPLFPSHHLAPVLVAPPALPEVRPEDLPLPAALRQRGHQEVHRVPVHQGHRLGQGGGERGPDLRVQGAGEQAQADHVRGQVGAAAGEVLLGAGQVVQQSAEGKRFKCLAFEFNTSSFENEC